MNQFRFSVRASKSVLSVRCRPLTRQVPMSVRNFPGRARAIPLRACCLTMFVVLAILFTAGCAVTKMAGTSTPSPAPAAGNLSVSASTVNFGSVPVGSTKSTSVTLSNSATQTATVQVSQVTISGQGFRLTGVALPTSLVPGHSLTLTISRPARPAMPPVL